MDTIKFKKLDEEAIVPTRAYDSDAGLDLYALNDIEILPSEVSKNFIGVDIGNAKVPTGISVEIPKGFYGMVVGRSGMAFKNNIHCFQGTIDSSYRGEIGVLLYNLTGRTCFIAKGDRIAQLIIMRCELPAPVEVSELIFGARGDGGFGHSGR